MNKLRTVLRNSASGRLSLRKTSFYFLSGVIVSIPFTFYAKTIMNRVSAMIPAFAARIFSTAIFTPFLEELAKAYPLMYRQGETERSIFLQGAVVGFGFGVAEALIYVFMLGAPMAVRLPGVLFHTLTAPITAYGMAKNRPLPPYLLAVTLHILNNLSAIHGLLWLIAGYPILLTTFSIAWYLNGKTSPTDFPINT